ncbi:MAG: hypothetical protein E4H18_05220 [Hyphomicrobiales bacterium]|nr:MAG: hypothetical protein E4H18_05220 [Hyphomicrobiales bacterium]
MSALSHAGAAGRKPPGKIWYLAAGLAALAGFVLAGFFGYAKLVDLTRELTQIVVPGEAVLTLEPGHYTIFHEYQSLVDGRLYSGTDVSGLQVRVAPADGGEPLALEQPGASSSYELGGRAGRSVLVFEVTQAGQYRLAAGYPQGEEKSQAVLAVGRETTGRILSLVFSVVGIIFLGVAAAVLIAVMTYRRRRAGVAPK